MGTMAIVPLVVHERRRHARTMSTPTTPTTRTSQPTHPADRPLLPDAALVVIDVQQGFRDPVFGRRSNPESEANIAALTCLWTATGRPLVRVRQASTRVLGAGRPGPSPLHPDAPGYAFEPFVEALAPDLDLTKNVHSAFHGDVDLHAWLGHRGIRQLVVCGIQTNMCCETTARIAGNLNYDVLFAHDATHTFDQRDPVTGVAVTAEMLTAATCSNLAQGFARVVATEQVLAAARTPADVGLSRPGAARPTSAAGGPPGAPDHPRAR